MRRAEPRLHRAILELCSTRGFQPVSLFRCIVVASCLLTSLLCGRRKRLTGGTWAAGRMVRNPSEN